METDFSTNYCEFSIFLNVQTCIRLRFCKGYVAELLQNIFPVVFERSNFSNEYSKNNFNACYKGQIESSLITVNFSKIRQRITTENLLKVRLVFNVIYRGKKKMLAYFWHILSVYMCVCMTLVRYLFIISRI